MSSYGYQSALEAAGATVHAFESFGDYQGSWYAKVTYKGETGWVSGSYGSCSGCDAFEAEFWCGDEDQEKLAAFGRSYLDGLIRTQEETEKMASQNLDWDMEAEGALEFVKENA